MFQEVQLSGYRGFESYKLTNLARVNLLVGKNNCGKTSVLEAIELVASGANYSVLSRSAQRRGELGLPIDERRRESPDIRHFFFGHECKPGQRFDILATAGEQKFPLTAKLLPLEELTEDVLDGDLWRRYRRFSSDEEIQAAFGLVLQAGAEATPMAWPVAEDGRFLRSRLLGIPRPNGQGGKPCRFLTLESSSPARMVSAWNKVLAAGLEVAVVKDLKFLMSNIESVDFLVGGGPRGILIGLEGGGRRIPIGSYGDGLRRLLGIRLALVGINNGVLLIDEIDTGLHWTVMQDMWQLVVKVAQELNVQVFATTHSLDCVRGLALLIQSHPDLAEQATVQRIDTSLKQAVSFRGDQVEVAVEQDIELR